ncbi:MAG: subtilisin family serine protease [Planctomycetota bacterium]|jgi:subtilisin family serine protease
MKCSNSRIRTLTVLCSLVLLLSCFSALVQAQAQSSTYQYFYFDEAINIELDTRRVAVFADDNPLPSLQAATSWDVSPSDVEKYTISGVYFLSLPATERSPKSIEKLVDVLSRQAGLKSATPVFFDKFGGALFFEPEVLIGFEDGALTTAQQRALILEFAPLAEPTRDWESMRNVWRFNVSANNGLDALFLANQLASRGDVWFAEPVMYFTAKQDFIPNDTLYGDLWGLHNTGQSGGLFDFDMDIAEAWDITKGSPSITVVIFETGVEQNHPDLNSAPGMDFTDDPLANAGAAINSSDNHGTAVAGCVSAKIDNNLGIIGVAPMCPVASARVGVANVPYDGMWAGSTLWTVNGINWAESSGARVTNNSNNYGVYLGTMAAAYIVTRQNGLVHFASSGNQSATTIGFPGSSPAVNGVGAVARTGSISSFSNTGTGVDFVGPGTDIVLLDRSGVAGYDPNGDYFTADGTSFSSPYVAAVAALILSVDPNLTPDEVEAAMRDSARDLGTPGYETTFGWGLVNANDAIALIDPMRKNFSGAVAGDEFGTAVASIGDINGDFVSDFIVGSPLSSNGSDLGRIYVISGSTGDILHERVGSQVGGKFGTAVCGTGDLTGDGIPDFAVGVPRGGNFDPFNPPTFGDYRGAVKIYSGATGIVVDTIYGDQPFSAFGSVLANAGDVNGDGVDDLIIGAHSADYGGSNSGRVKVYSGATRLLLYGYDGIGAGDRFGFAADGVGDLNHDGFDDFSVGAWFNDTNGNNAGAVYIFSGANGAVLHTLYGNSTGSPLGGGFGFSVSGPGDVNCDGTPDILVGSPYTDGNGTDCGSARVFSGVDGALIHLFTGVSAGDNLGYSVGNVGDLNGDGYDDCLVGAPFDDDNGTDCGVVRVYSGLDGVRIQKVEGLTPNDNLGKVVSGLGDVNLDGFADLLLGAPGSSINGPGSGAASVVISPTLPTGVYDFGQSGLALKLVWVPDNGDANSLTGAIVVLNATAGGTGINVASLAPALFPTPYGFPLLVANDPGNVLETGSFGFNGLGVLVAPGISRQNPALAGTTVFIQIFEISPSIQGSNGLKFLLE